LPLLLGVVMAMPTVLYFVRQHPLMIMIGMATFALPLVGLLSRMRPSEGLLVRWLGLLTVILVPLSFSLVLHFPLYGNFELVAAVSRIIAVVIFSTLALMIVADPDQEFLLNRAFLVLGILLAGLFVVAAAAFPQWHWSRFMPAGLQPNWWGEILLAIAFCGCFVRFRPVRYGLLGLALVGLFLVQSRSSIVATLPVVGFGILAREGFKRMTLIGVAAGMLVLLVDGAVLRGAIVLGVYDFVANDVFLINSEARGLASGASGRADGWIEALGLIEEEPLTGVGFGRSNPIVEDQVGGLLHSGHLILLADLGIAFYAVIMIVMLGGLVRSVLSGRYVFAGLIFGYFALMFVQPRAINANVVSMLSWVAIAIAWLSPLQTPAPEDTRATTPPRPRSRIGDRWRSANLVH
jgi:hypothetical protein